MKMQGTSINIAKFHNPFTLMCAGLLGVEGWVEVSDHPQAEDTVVVPTEHKSVQTEQDEPICQTSMCGLLEEENKEALTSHLEPPTEDRSVEECLGIYKSEVKIQAVVLPAFKIRLYLW
jgi:hypothetical protein